MSNQFFVFSLSLGCGALLGILFDFFRALRKKVHFGTLGVAVQDLIFWILAALVTFLLTYFSNQGEIRWYIFFAVFCGALIYNATLSRAVVWLIIKIACGIKFLVIRILKIIVFPVILIFRPLKKPFLLICIPIKKFSRYLKMSLGNWISTIKKVKKRLKLY